MLGETVLRLITGQAPPNLEIPANGEISLRRYFAVGDGTASSIADIRNDIDGIDTGVETTRNFNLPRPGSLRVSVTGQPLVGVAGPVSAKLQVVGFDPSPPLRNRVLASTTGVFGDDADTLPYGITLVEFIDRNGMSPQLTLEPGDYQVVVSLGPRYSAFKQDITIAPRQTTSIDASLVQVLDTPGYIHGDFHVHSIDRPDTEVTRDERIATYLAEGMDFFTPSDHGIRVDFTGTLAEMDVLDLIGTASSGEITPFDYGHLNSWPVSIDDSKIGGGSVDWGREGPVGVDFPEYASYVLSPQEIFAAALADPLGNIVQINHIASHFGEAGLAIDTGMTPPQSQVDLTERRMDPEPGQ